MIKLSVLLALLMYHCGAQAAWFTITGSPDDATVNTIEVDPVPEDSADGLRAMRLRVSRSTDRRNWEGQHYRSYVARVLFDCPKKSARYLSIEYFAQPLWQGTALRTTDYTRGTPRPMLFLDVSPNPTARIVRAACNI